jgi:3'-5' exoribonuclease
MVTLSDRTGEREGRMWDNAEDFDARVAPGDFVKAKLRGRVWQGQMQLEVAFLEAVPVELVDASLFLPVCPRDVQPYWDAVAELTASLGDLALRKLCAAALDDPEIGDGLRRAPAATGVHQPYIGGLLEHVCSMMLLADMVCRHYPALDRDLLLTGVLFHDLGKIRELAYSLALDYTDEGKLIGHLMFGVEYIDRLTAASKLPPERAMQLKHLVLSHHGRPEFGAAKIPMFAEAAVLHYLDNLDAKVFGFLEAESETAKGAWSERKWALETAVYKIRPNPKGYHFALPDKRAAGKAKAHGPEGEDLPLFRK